MQIDLILLSPVLGWAGVSEAGCPGLLQLVLLSQQYTRLFVHTYRYAHHERIDEIGKLSLLPAIRVMAY